MSELDEIRARSTKSWGGSFKRAAADVDALLAALTEALRERDEWPSSDLDADTVDARVSDNWPEEVGADGARPRMPGLQAAAGPLDVATLVAALTEAEHRADLAERRNLLNPQSTEYVQKLERQVAFLKASLAEYDRLFVDTTDGPGGTG